jgi:Uma2 family endonuclease
MTPTLAPAPRDKPVPVRWTRDEYHRLGETGLLAGRRVELIRGEIYEMSPISWRHALAKTRVVRVLDAVFEGTAWVQDQNPFQAGDSEPQPDAAVIPGRPEDYTDHPTTALLIVEVSDTTLDHDVTVKAELYATAGVPDYWVLDVDGRQLRVFRDPAPIPGGGAACRTQRTYGPADAVAPLAAPAAPVQVADLLP